MKTIVLQHSQIYLAATWFVLSIGIDSVVLSQSDPGRAALQISPSVQPLHPRVQLHAEQLMFDIFPCGILEGYTDACTLRDDQAQPSFVRKLPLTSFGSIRWESVSALIGLDDAVD